MRLARPFSFAKMRDRYAANLASWRRHLRRSRAGAA